MNQTVSTTRITVTNAILAALFLAAGVILTLTNHNDAGGPLIGVAVGLAVGAGTPSIVAVASRPDAGEVVPKIT